MDLVKILKDCPKVTKLYSPLVGVVEFDIVDVDDPEYPITVCYNDKDNNINFLSFTKEGLCYSYAPDGECMLWPSKEVRTWDNFKPKKPKFDPKTLQPFDRVLARIDGGDYCWFADFVSTPTIEKYDTIPCIMGNQDVTMVIPYNEETKHLVGTNNEAPEFYRYWEE